MPKNWDDRSEFKEKPLVLTAQNMADLIAPLLERGQRCRFVSGGNSMAPFIKDKDLVTIAPFAGGSLCLGTVVAYRHPVSRCLVIHRIVSKNRDGYVVKGDNCGFSDGVIHSGHVLGVLAEVKRQGRNVCFGLGREKRLIGFLSRCGLLSGFKARAARASKRLFTGPGV